MEIVKEGLHIYTVCDYQENPYYTSTEVPMLRHNMPGSFLPVQIRDMDGKKAVYYEITGRCSLLTWAESRKIGYEECRKILEGICLLLKDIEEYLLSLDQVSLSKEEIYIGEKGRLLWLYTPFREENVQKKMEDLLLYLLSVVDYHDRKAIDLVYHAIHRLKREGLSRMVLGELTQHKENPSDTEFHLKSLSELDRYGDNNLFGKDPFEKDPFEKDPFEKDPFGKNPDVRSRDKGGHGKKTKKGKGKKRILINALILLSMGMDLAAFFYLCYCISIRGSTIFLTICLTLAILVFVLLLPQGMKIFLEKKDYGLTNRDPEENRKKYPEAWKEDFPENRKNGYRDNWKENEECNQKKDPWGRWKKDFREEWLEEGHCDETIFLSMPSTSEKPVLCSKDTGESIEIQVFPFYIGSEAGLNQLPVKNRAVSRQHAVILRGEGEDYYLHDLNSKNGTTVNGKKVIPEKEILLQDGDQIAFADDLWTFHKSTF